MKQLLATFAILTLATSGFAATLDLQKSLSECQQISGKKAAEINNQPVVLTVGATWCKFCKALDPKNEALAEKYLGKIIFVDILTDRSVLADAKLVASDYPNLSVYFNEPDTVSQYVPFFPYSIVIDKNGNELFTGEAEADFDAYLKAVDAIAQ